MLSFFALFYFNDCAIFIVQDDARIHTANKTFPDCEFFPLSICVCSLVAAELGGTKKQSRSFYLSGCLCLECCLDGCLLKRKAYQTLPIAMVAFWKIKEKY